MTLKQPKDMSECVYFTRRDIGKGKVKAWVFKELCPRCKEGLMAKPKDPKSGKSLIRAKEYVCHKCNNSIEQKEYEDTLIVNIEYACPHCSHEGEIRIPFKRKKAKIYDEEDNKQKTADVLRFTCSKCGKNIDITKKMK